MLKLLDRLLFFKTFHMKFGSDKKSKDNSRIVTLRRYRRVFKHNDVPQFVDELTLFVELVDTGTDDFKQMRVIESAYSLRETGIRFEVDTLDNLTYIRKGAVVRIGSSNFLASSLKHVEDVV